MAPDPVIQRRLDHLWELHGDELELLDERCTGTYLAATGNLPEAHTCGCGGQTRVRFAYRDSGSEELAAARLCAVCDRVYDMPRFL